MLEGAVNNPMAAGGSGQSQVMRGSHDTAGSVIMW